MAVRYRPVKCAAGPVGRGRVARGFRVALHDHVNADITEHVADLAERRTRIKSETRESVAALIDIALADSRPLKYSLPVPYPQVAEVNGCSRGARER